MIVHALRVIVVNYSLISLSRSVGERQSSRQKNKCFFTMVEKVTICTTNKISAWFY